MPNFQMPNLMELITAGLTGAATRDPLSYARFKAARDEQGLNDLFRKFQMDRMKREEDRAAEEEGRLNRPASMLFQPEMMTPPPTIMPTMERGRENTDVIPGLPKPTGRMMPNPNMTLGDLPYYKQAKEAMGPPQGDFGGAAFGTYSKSTGQPGWIKPPTPTRPSEVQPHRYHVQGVGLVDEGGNIIVPEPPKSPEEKSQSEEQLTARALHGDKESQAILDAMQKRKVDIASANANAQMTSRLKGIDVPALARAVRNNQETMDNIANAFGVPVKAAVQSEVLKQDPNFNFVLQKMGVQGDLTGIKQMSGLRDKILSFEQAAIQNGRQVYQLSKQINVSRFPVLNNLILKGETQVAGNPVESNYLLAWRTFVNEYARVATSATGGGVTSDQARKEIENAIRASATPEQIQANIRQAILEMKHREYGFAKRLHDVKLKWGESIEQEPQPPTSEDIFKIVGEKTPQVTMMPKGATGSPKTADEYLSLIGQGEGATGVGNPLDEATARKILQEAGGDKNKAREIAKQRGYTF